MGKAGVLQRMGEVGLLPVVRAESVGQALLFAEALAEGGATVLEITMTVPGAIDVIERLVRERPELLIGAGTVLDVESARACLDAGAQFVVSPALDVATVELCNREGVAVLPGALTPTEILTAWRAGADTIKVFPAGAMGGASYLRSLKGPLPQIPLLPTGGVSLETAADFLRAGAVAVGVGTDLVNPGALREGGKPRIVEMTRRYVEIVAAQRSEASSR